MRFQPPTLHQGGVPRTKKDTQNQKQGETHDTQGRMVPNLVVISLAPAQCYARYIQWVRWSAVKCIVPHAPRTRLAQVSIRFGTALLGSPQLSILPAVISVTRIAGFNSTWLVFSSLPRSCVHGAVTRLWNHTLIGSSSFDSTAIRNAHAALSVQVPMSADCFHFPLSSFGSTLSIVS